jgi:hypothetical protein
MGVASHLRNDPASYIWGFRILASSTMLLKRERAQSRADSCKNQAGGTRFDRPLGESIPISTGF